MSPPGIAGRVNGNDNSGHRRERSARGAGRRRSLPRPEDALRLCSSIYEAALEPEEWWPLARRLAYRVDARVWVLKCGDLASATLPFAYEYGAEPSDLQSFVNAGFVNNAAARAMAHVPAGRLFRLDRVPWREELVRDRFWQQFLAPRDLERVVAATMHSRGACVTTLSVCRSTRQPDFAAEEMAFLEAIVPHIQRATQIMLRLGANGEVGSANLDVVERLALAVCLFDRAGRVVYANAAARELAGGDGLALAGGGLVAASAVENSALRRAILAAAATGCGRGASDGARLRITRPSGAPPYEVTVAPLGPGPGPVLGAPTRPVAVAFVSDPALTPRIDAGELPRRYGLTRAEVEVALGTLRVTGAAELATALGISVNTAKTHLKRIYAKTCTRGQTELVQLLARGLGTPLRG